MADPNNISLRSEKGSTLTYEEVDLNFLELQNLITEHNIVADNLSTLDGEFNTFKNVTDDAILALQNATGFSYQGNYEPATTYGLGSVVTFTNGLDYISTESQNLGNQPDTNPDFWINLTSKSIAEFVSYDNTDSGLTATDIQAAINEILNRRISQFGSQVYDTRTTSFSAVAGSWYGLDASVGAFTITLNATPTTGDVINFLLVAGDVSVNNLLVARNGQTIEDLAEDMTITNNQPRAFSLYFNGTTWRVFT